MFWRVHFIGDDYRRLTRTAKKLRQFEIERDGTGAGVRHQNHMRRILDRHMRLAKNFSGDTGFVFRDDPARVDHLEGPAFPFRSAVDAVARDAGLVGDDRAACTGQAIEERRLAHVGPSDNYDGWQFACDRFGVAARFAFHREPGARRAVLYPTTRAAVIVARIWRFQAAV